MQRRTFIVLVGTAACWPLATRAQQKAMPVIGWLAAGRPDPSNPSFIAFHQGLGENGYIEGRNLAIEYRFASGMTERFPALAADLVARKVDVIVSAGGTLAALAAKGATTTIPIVFTAVGDPVAEGLVASLARPGGNITGLSLVQTDLVGKWLELLKEVVPGIRVVALLLKPDSMPAPAKEIRLREADAAARALGLQMPVVEARGPEDFDRAFAEIAEARADAVLVMATPVFENERRRLIDLAAKNRLPSVFSLRWNADDGGLMSYGPNIADVYRRAAGYVHKILSGAKPADLPVQQPTKFELVINLKTAKALGLRVPQSLFARADEVIE